MSFFSESLQESNEQQNCRILSQNPAHSHDPIFDLLSSRPQTELLVQDYFQKSEQNTGIQILLPKEFKELKKNKKKKLISTKSEINKSSSNLAWCCLENQHFKS